MLLSTVGLTTLLPFSGSASDEVTHYSIRDTFVSEEYPSSSYWGEEWMAAGKNITGIGHEWWPLVRFDVSGVPGGAVVGDASIRLYVNAFATGRVWLCIHELNSSWSECVTYSGVPGQGGCMKKQFVAPGWTSIIFDCTALVQGWLVNPGSNYGLVVNPSSECGDEYVTFWVREHVPASPLFISHTNTPGSNPQHGAT